MGDNREGWGEGASCWDKEKERGFGASLEVWGVDLRTESSI